MLKNYLTASIRSLLKKKGFTILNTLGLSLGIASAVIIFLYVQFETSYDSFHENADNIYRVELDQYKDNELLFASSENYPGAGPAIVEELPEVIEYARLYNMGAKNNMVIAWEEAPGGPIEIKTSSMLYADSSFLPMFSYEVVKGDINTALGEPFKIVITESVAKKYFGEEDPIGKSLRMRDDDFNDEKCEVTAVLKDSPLNTHLKFDFLISYKTLFARGDWAPGRYDLSWQRKDMYSYIQVKDGVDPKEIESKLPAIVEKYNPELAEQGRKDVLLLQPLRDIHLYSDLTDEAEANGDGNAVNFLFIIGIFILLIAWVNYVNLSTAKVIERAGEVGVRKTVGASKAQLFTQFMIESFLINLFAVLISLLIIYLTVPFFQNQFGMNFSAGFWTSRWFLFLITGILIVGSFLSGSYPSMVLSSYRPAVVLKGKMRNSSKGNLLRRSLVVFQFTASVFLITGTLLVNKQLNFMNQQDLGYKIDQTLVVQRPGVVERDFDLLREKYSNFKTEVNRISKVQGMAATFFLPGKKLRFKVDIKEYGKSDDEMVSLSFSGMDYDAIDQLEMKLAAGRGFSREYATDADTAIMVTRSAAELFGYQNPEDILGKALTNQQFRFTGLVIGVLEDYHQESLQVETQPTIFFMNEFGLEYNMIKVDSDDLPNTIAAVEEVWKSTFPGNPFEYFFLDEYFDAQYKNERKFAGLFGFFAVLAIIIGCLGLLGLSAYTAQQRTKEIGVRKVMGSSVQQILLLLNKDFLQLVLFSVILSWPLVYFAMNRWLESFAYKTNFSFLILIYSGLIVLAIAFITVSLQTLKAARANPAVSLKEE